MDKKIMKQAGNLISIFEVLGDDVSKSLTEKEISFLKWLSGWEKDTCNSFVSIVEKVKK